MTVETMLDQTVAVPQAPQANDALFSLILRQHQELASFLELVAMDGARALLPAAVRVTTFGRVNGFSGYEYTLGDSVYAKLAFAPLLYGGFAVHRLLSSGKLREESYDIYSEQGILLLGEIRLSREPLYVDLTEMEPQCPVVSHLYNYLAYEYAQARKGSSRPRQVRLLESFLRRLAARPESLLSVKAGAADRSVQDLSERILRDEDDTVLTWSERQLAYQGIRAEREKVMSTKERVHRLGWTRYRLPVVLQDVRDFGLRLLKRPGSNFKGISYRYTIGVMIWFLKTVKGNIGYSIALAIYGPFTFYFITQPLNPQAMWAVGKVRSGYLETVGKARQILNLDDSAAVAAVGANDAIIAPTGVSPEGTAHEEQKDGHGPTGVALAAGATTAPAEKSPVATNLSRFTPANRGILVSTDVPAVDAQSWADRMSSFKDMQIGFEEHLQFSARMGRLEQLETQINFPLIAEGAWLELERYLGEVSALREKLKADLQGSKAAAAFLEQEDERARRLQLYVWDRLYRYILDHPYIVLDQAGEQTYRDYYLSRMFILFRDITLKLSKDNAGLKKPAAFKRIEKVAASFQKSKKEGDTILERLARNTGLFAQQNRLDGRELRAYMKRQWEVLFLLQNKAQEASNFGLQSYTWSVRNTLYILQSFYSAKRRELGLLFDGQGKFIGGASAKEIRATIEPLYETLFYAMNLEYASLKPELAERLANDIEYGQREVVITTMESFLRERDQLLGSMAVSK